LVGEHRPAGGQLFMVSSSWTRTRFPLQRGSALAQANTQMGPEPTPANGQMQQGLFRASDTIIHDHHASRLIHTCELNGANAFDYLTEAETHGRSSTESICVDAVELPGGPGATDRRALRIKTAEFKQACRNLTNHWRKVLFSCIIGCAMPNDKITYNNKILHGWICLWIVAIQVFYFYRFSPIIFPLLKSMVHKVWH
jgi:hypothetical protein